MLIKKKKARSHTEDRCLALVLATAAGILNAMALSAFGFLPSHMSGNASQMSTEVAHSDTSGLLFLAALLLAFVIGSMVARVAVVIGQKIRTIFCLILLAEGVALTAVSMFELLFYSTRFNAEVLVTLGFLMGVHNATSTQLSNGRVRSTHVTGTLTDAGIALGSFLSSLVARGEATDRRSCRKQLYTHLTTICSFLTGCIVGVALFDWFGFKAMLGLGGILIVVPLSAIVITVRTASKWVEARSS
ncbi:YoaK family protein [Halomonas alkaliantarctica]|uniref:YoaK family protein n=1 Tax=Halomonas alkaliantarctica TaxID=232346 RepID=A0ABY8LP90_9GAMM|nr:YoaK family protein [Halomonas alkaliantarctica]WGI26218.1 YoaK family protein [Halomonas alkaliantarctica]